ncbi:TadE/TadG family type IV pilus assembly protein [Jeongeupia sp. USM3]|uniref:TadE/TadG family type IV pilus assembly protein n=1 Tax=Jeongeupia sp. USM3 TaxID=1906741 RepID=UPI00089DF7B5|nr:TadE/TadG family type IV pilus assembly protein [Jeongeupia sp. USM3]AOY01208.1 hypothetical protein BJP62_12595 [Jeongeupia sp. USM3]
MQRQTGKRMAGAAAVEFALTLPLLLLLAYGMIAYALLFLLQQQLSLAAAEGARVAMRYYPDEPARAAASRMAARQAVSLVNLTDDQIVVVRRQDNKCVPSRPSISCYDVTITYGYAANPLLPAIALPGLALLPYPPSVGSHASAQVDQSAL